MRPARSQSQGSRRRLLTAVALAALALVLAGWLAGRSTGGEASARKEAPSTDLVLDSAPTSPRDNAPREQIPLAEEALEATAPEAPTASDLQRVHVVEGTSGAAVPGAEVLWLRYDRHDEARAEALRNTSLLDELLEEGGQRALADVSGVATIARGEGALAIAGRAPGLWGLGARAGDAPGELRLELWPDGHLDVEVHDHRGLPAEGVPVALRHATSWMRDDSPARTDSNGRARLDHVLAHRTGGSRDEGPWVVAAAALLKEPVRAPVDLHALPREPVRLRLPPTGSLEVSVRGPEGGVVAAGEVFVRVLLEGSMAPFAPSAKAPLEGGQARFDFVETGLELTVHARPEGARRSATVQAAGPLRGDQVVHVVVVHGADHPVYRLRAVDTSGAPITSAALDAWVGSPNVLFGDSFDVRTDDLGQFEVDLVPGFGPAEESRILRLSRAAGGEAPPLEGERRLEPLDVPGLHDLGDVLLAQAPLLAEGVVVNTQGDPVAGAGVYLHLFDLDDRWEPPPPFGPPRKPRPTWRQSSIADGTGADGGFLLHGTIPAGRTSLVARAESHASTRVELERGARDLRIVLQGTATLAGRLLTDEVTPPESLQLRAKLQSVGGVPAGDLDRDLALMSPFEGEGRVRADGSFALHELQPGAWSLSVVGRHPSRTSVLREIDGIELATGKATVDPRLDPLDLRGSARMVRIELVPPEQGMPLRGGCAWRESGSHDKPWWFPIHGPQAKLLLLQAPLDVELMVHGCRPVLLRGVVADVQIALRPGLAVRLHLPADLRIPEPPDRLQAQLSVPGSLGSGSGMGPHLPFGEQGELAIRAGGPGITKVWLSIAPAPGVGGNPVRVNEKPFEFELAEVSEEQVFEFPVKQDEIDSTLARFAQRE